MRLLEPVPADARQAGRGEPEAAAHLEGRLAAEQLVNQDANAPHVHLQDAFGGERHHFPSNDPCRLPSCHKGQWLSGWTATHLAAVVPNLVWGQAQPLDVVRGGHCHHLRGPVGAGRHYSNLPSAPSDNSKAAGAQGSAMATAGEVATRGG